MKQKTLLKLIVTLISLAGVIGVGFYFILLPQLNRNKTVNTLSNQLFGWKFPVAKFPLTGSGQETLAYSDIRDPGGIPQGLPVRLKIPSIGVDSAIEDALITSDGRMDVPAGSANVAWFSLGPHPGQAGSAVIGGHFGISNGVPFVFYKLDKLRVGDKIYIVDDKNDTLAFVVRSTKSFDRDADATSVFTSTDGLAHLNLITCEGTWNQINNSYPQRLVVFTDAITSESPTAIPGASAPVVTQPTTSTGTKNPTQTSPTAAPMPSVSTIPVPPETTPMLIEKIESPSNSENPMTSSQILLNSLKSLYATPLDGLITLLLVISIMFVAFKIIRLFYYSIHPLKKSASNPH